MFLTMDEEQRADHELRKYRMLRNLERGLVAAAVLVLLVVGIGLISAVYIWSSLRAG